MSFQSLDAEVKKNKKEKKLYTIQKIKFNLRSATRREKLPLILLLALTTSAVAFKLDF